MRKLPATPKILLRSPNWVGDAIMATPVARALKCTWPNGELHILAKDWVAPVWERHPDVSKIYCMDEKTSGVFGWLQLTRQLRAEQYDLGVILPNSFSSAWLAFWAKCTQRIGYATEGRGFLLSEPVTWLPALDRAPRPHAYLNLACQADADVDVCKEWNFVLRVSGEEVAAADAKLGLRGSGLLIGIAPGSVAQSRRWPVDRFARLAELITQAGHRVVLVGSKPDRGICLQIQKQVKFQLLNTAGETQLREALAIIKRLDFLVSNDSGAMHMAYAQGVPLLVLQGASDQQVTGPFGKESHYIRDHSVECSPCVKNQCRFDEIRCMQKLSLEAVWAELQTLMESVKNKNGKANAK